MATSKTLGFSKKPYLEDFELYNIFRNDSFGWNKIAVHSETGNVYVLRIYSKQQVVQLDNQEKVLREKEILNEADHPFLVRLFQTFSDKLNLYMVKQFIQGGELFSLIKKQSISWDVNSISFYAGCIVLALEYLHKTLKVVYRNLSPEMILLDANGYPMLADFILAKRVLHDKTKTWTLCGAPEYLSPEVIENKGHSFPVDLWALGILVYELRAGVTPFYEEDNMKIYSNISKGKFKYPAKLFPKKNSENAPIRSLVDKLLQKKPEKRLGSDDFEALKNHELFKNIEWEEILRKKVSAPWTPKFSDKLDVSNFEELAPELTEEMEQGYGEIQDDAPFQGF